MELPQPRPCGTQGKSTHDFLSLYSQVQDPISPQGANIRTHDFLQPLERPGQHSDKEESTEKITASEKPPLPIAPPMGKYVLPGGIGTYSISHISSYFNQRVPKPEGSVFTASPTNVDTDPDEESNCSSHTGSGFTLWEESAVRKGKTGKENHSGDTHAAREGKIGGQLAVLERPSQSFSSMATSNPNLLTRSTTFTSRSSPQPPSQKSQSFVDMLKDANAVHSEDDGDEECNCKKEASPHLKSELTAKVGVGGGKGVDQKPNTPRSKHSATEQRRRSKINDRFQMLREIIPHSDQKRDKASFLLEVIEYIQYLQEKVHKYEGPYQGWNQELPKLMPWLRSNKHSEGLADQSLDLNTNHIPTVVSATKSEKGINFSPTSPLNGQKAMGSDMKTATYSKAIEHRLGFTNRALPVQTNMFAPGGSASMVSPTPARVASDCNTASNKLREQDLTIEGGVISISTAYSQGLLNTFTQALQNSGVDLSHANISVQIDIGKRAHSRPPTSTSAVKDDDDDIRHDDRVTVSPIGKSTKSVPNQERKRLRTS